MGLSSALDTSAFRASPASLHHDAALFVLGQHLKNVLNTGRGALGQVDVLWLGGVAVATLDELGDVFTDMRDTLRVGICANAANVLEQKLGARNGVLRIQLQQGFPVFRFQKLRVVAQGSDLAEKRDRLLLKLLGVANVAKDHTFKPERFVRFQLLCRTC